MPKTENKQIVPRRVEHLVPYANNARTHSDEQIVKICASITEFGFVNPVLVDADGGIIAGHGRVMAARKLGLAEVPTLLIDNLTEEQKKAYILADNKLALDAGWDEDLLRLEIIDLQNSGYNLGFTGFDSADLDNLLAEVEDRSGNKDDVPDIPTNPTTIPGDLWLLGKHRLLCGDVTLTDDMSLLMGGGACCHGLH